MFHDEPIVMDFVGQPNDESNEVYFYFQLRNNTNDTMINCVSIVPPSKNSKNERTFKLGQDGGMYS
jgi:hypothetical protein